MKPVLTLAFKEFRDGFRSPLFFLFLTGVLLTSHQLFLSTLFLRGEASLDFFFYWLPLLWVAFLPAITMDRWSGETRHGTLDLLMALPLRQSQIVLGKFLGCVFVLILTLALTLPLAITVSQIGDLDWGVVLSSGLGCFLIGIFGLSLGLGFSRLTRVPLVAFLATLVTLTLLTVIANPILTQNLPSALRPALAVLSLDENIKPYFAGMLPLKNSAYLLGATVWFLWAQSVASKRGRLGLMVLAPILLAGVFALPNSVFLDLTRDNTHSLSPQTTAIVQNLKDRLTVKLYFSDNVPFEVQKIQNELENLILTFKQISPHDVVLERVNVESDTGRERARQMGIEPLQMSIREQNAQKVQEIYLGFSVHYQDKLNVVPLATNPDVFESQIALSTLKLTANRMPRLGVTLPAGAARLEYASLLAILEQLADVVILSAEQTLPSDIQAWLILDPKTAPATLGHDIEAALTENIPVILFASRADVADTVTQTTQVTGLEGFLQNHGITITPRLALDADQNASAQFDLGTSQVSLDYPFWLKVYRDELNTRHPVTAGLEELLLPWTNVLQFDTAKLKSDQIEVLVKTSPDAFLQEDGNLSVSPQYVETMKSLPLVQAYPVAAQLQLQAKAAPLFVVASTQMVRNNFLNASYFTEATSNAAFAANLVEYTTWGDKLIGLRTREKTATPLAKLNATQKNTIHWGLMAVQILLPSILWLTSWSIRRRQVQCLASEIVTSG